MRRTDKAARSGRSASSTRSARSVSSLKPEKAMSLKTKGMRPVKAGKGSSAKPDESRNIRALRRTGIAVLSAGVLLSGILFAERDIPEGNSMPPYGATFCQDAEAAAGPPEMALSDASEAILYAAAQNASPADPSESMTGGSGSPSGDDPSKGGGAAGGGTSGTGQNPDTPSETQPQPSSRPGGQQGDQPGSPSGDQQGNQSEHQSEDQSEHQSEDQSEHQSEDQSEHQSEDQSEHQSENQSENQSEDQSEHQSENQSENQSEDQSESQSEIQSESQSEIQSESQSEIQSESQSEIQSESQSETQPETQPESQSETQPHTEPEPQKPEWPQGQYLVRITDVAAVIPEGGRVYDGTDNIDITYKTQVVRIPDSGKERRSVNEQNQPAQTQPSDEEIPEYHVAHTAHLENADAGERKVICSFSLQTSYPEHVKLDETTTQPDLSVDVKKAVLSIRISNGTKRYADPADMEHIRLEKKDAVTVRGFVKDAAGNDIIPPGFEPPSVDVDHNVLEQYSPIYEQKKGALSGSMAVKTYERALSLKRDARGSLTGNPTANYEFCQDPDDPRCVLGSVVIRRAPVTRDATYVLKGEKGAYRFDKDGTVIVRSGSFLTAEPVPGQGYNTGFRKENITTSGTITFRMEKCSKEGMILADSEETSVRIRVDGEAPDAVISVNGASMSGGTYFSSTGAVFSIQTPDDENGGEKKVQYRVLSGSMGTESVLGAMKGNASLSASASWEEIGANGKVTLSNEQICAVEVQVTDSVGNVSVTKSPPVVIDTEKPQIEIKGVEDESANGSGVRIMAQCLDPSYLPQSMKAEMTADSGGIIPKYTVNENSSGGAMISFEGFPMRKEADAVYHLTVTASDRAGNSARKQISFSVNRFGSNYSLSTATTSALKQYYHNKPFDVTFIESNLDKVGNARVLLRSGKSLTEITSGNYLRVSGRKTEKGLSQYTYTVPASCFKNDGPYEVMLLTTDRAGNSSDSSAQKLPVRFAIDSTSPECLISGIKPEGRYKAEEVTVVIEPRDNLELNKAEVYLNAQKKGTWSGKELGTSGGILKLKLGEKEQWQTVQVHVTDMAENEIWTKEVPVYISSDAPEEAENYQQKRLSAQQVDTLVRYVRNIRQSLADYRLIRDGHIVLPGWLFHQEPYRSGTIYKDAGRSGSHQTVSGTVISTADDSLQDPYQYTSINQRKGTQAGNSNSQEAEISTVHRRNTVSPGAVVGCILAIVITLAALGTLVFRHMGRRGTAVFNRRVDASQWDWVNDFKSHILSEDPGERNRHTRHHKGGRVK